MSTTAHDLECVDWTWLYCPCSHSYARTRHTRISTCSLNFTLVNKLRVRPSVRPRLHTTSEEMMFLFVSPLVAIKLSHAESQRAQRESYLFIFTPPTPSLPHFHFSPLCSPLFFSLGFELYYLHSQPPRPPPPATPSSPALLSWLRIAVAAGGIGDRRQPSDCFMIHRKRTSWRGSCWFNRVPAEGGGGLVDEVGQQVWATVSCQRVSRGCTRGPVRGAKTHSLIWSQDG